MQKVVLVAEDDFLIRHDIMRFLELNDFHTIGAENGKIALELTRKHKPDIIISDIMMPEMDGYEFLKELLAVPDTATIPFLFLSAKTDRSAMREGMNIGADDYISKPFDFIELLSAIESRIKKRETSDNQYYQKFEELRSNLRRSLPHEIRNPLNVVLGFSELLLKSYENSSPDEIKDILSNIYESALRLNHLFENYLIYANLEILATNPEDVQKLTTKRTFSVQSVINDIALPMAEDYSRVVDVQIEIEDAILMISQEYFSKIVEEIVSNSLKYSKPNTKIHIKGKIISNSYHLAFTDNGRGMTKDQIMNLGAYMQFERRIYEQQGLGLGLVIAKRIVELHRGRFAIVSQFEKYTTVNIILPCL